MKSDLEQAKSNRAKRAIRQHYRLNRPVTDAELESEIWNLKRRHAARTLDNPYEELYSRLATIGVFDTAAIS